MGEVVLLFPNRSLAAERALNNAMQAHTYAVIYVEYHALFVQTRRRLQSMYVCIDG